MTTTLPDPAGEAVARRVGGELRRLAAMPRTWEPTIAELLEDEARQAAAEGPHRRHPDAVDAPLVPAVLPTTAPPVGDRRSRAASLADLDAALDQVAVIEAQVATLHARRAVLVAHIMALAEALESDLVDDADPVARSAPSSRRLELARRAVVAELATTLHVGEHGAATLADHATALTAKAPRTLAALHHGDLSWTHVTQVTKHLADLTGDQAAHVEIAALAAGPCTPAQLGARARRARDVEHPVPAEVRHAEAATRRAVWLDDGRDGMAWLTAHLPAPLAHAAYDRLTRTARHLTSPTTSRHATSGHPTDTRTPSQARADVLAALLLDDGTLDTTSLDTTRVTLPRPDAPDEAPHEPADHSQAPRPTPDLARDQVQQLPLGQSWLATLARSIRPQVTVTVPVLTLLGTADATATMNGHVPIDPDTARQLTALAPSLRRILTHPETGTVLSVGRTTYTVPADLKALVTARDTTCRFPGCTRPARTADLDHTVAWAHGGTTSAENLAVLCRRHHTVKHQSRWAVRQVPEGSAPPTRERPGPPGSASSATPGWGGILEWTSPTGRTFCTEPAPPETTRHRTMPRGHEPPPY